MATYAIRFISSNKHKLAESEKILKPIGVKLMPVNLKIDEIQSDDTLSLIKDKALKAFTSVGHPLFVEHTGLYINYLNGLPGGLTQIFWDKLQAERFSEVFGKLPDGTVIARTTIGYVDGRMFHSFSGEIEGTVAPSPKGDKSFQWDCVFVPKGESRTFAEMGDEKNKISMRRKALDKFADYLKKKGVA